MVPTAYSVRPDYKGAFIQIKIRTTIVIYQIQLWFHGYMNTF